MSKKNFTAGLNSLLESTDTEQEVQKKRPQEKPKSAPQKRGRPKTNFKEISKTSQEGTLPGESRATFIVNEMQLEKLKAVAFWDRVSIKEVMHEAIDLFLSKKGSKYVSNAHSEFKKRKKA